MERLRIHNGDITLDCRAAGAESGELVILLHGFPECWTAWRQQIQPLADAGYRVIVPDMRGYGCSSRPRHPKKRTRKNEIIIEKKKSIWKRKNKKKLHRNKTKETKNKLNKSRRKHKNEGNIP